MQPMPTIRTWQLEQLRMAIPILRQLVEGLPPEAAQQYRDSGDGWTVTEVVCHLRDYENLFLERARLTLEKDHPHLPNPDPEQLARDKAYNEQNLHDALEAWARQRDTLVNYYTNVPDAHWERAGQHPRRGHFSLNDQLLLTVWHDMNHLQQIAKILREKQVKSEDSAT